MAPSLLISLPPELLQMILSSAPDALTLQSLTLTRSSLHRCYLSIKGRIIRDMLHNEFSPGVIASAIAAFESAHLHNTIFELDDDLEPNDQDTTEFLRRYVDPRSLISASWSLACSVETSKIREKG